MDTREVVRRLKAHAVGQALPRGETLHFPIADTDHLLIVAFLRMGGESRPWGVAWGRPQGEPQILTVPEGRNRDLVGQMCAQFAPALLSLFQAPGFVDEHPTSQDELTGQPIQQVWLPNDSHVDMLHHLAYAYPPGSKWDVEPPGRLAPLGRLCGWLQRESFRPGQLHIMSATRVLREVYTFPAQDLRLGHLGYLLGWLQGPSGQRRVAAEAGELEAMSTSLDPSLSRLRLEEPVGAWNDARRAGNKKGMEQTAAEITAILEPELLRRWELVERAINILRKDPRVLNPGVVSLVKQALAEHWYQYLRIELGFLDTEDGPPYVPSPETDRHPAAAGSRYLVHDASDDLLQFELLHYDSELQADAIGRGDAFKGPIVEVIDESKDRKAKPVWVVRDPLGGINRLHEGAHVCVIGMPQRTAHIRRIEEKPDGSREFELEITNRKKAVRDASGQDGVDPADPSWAGVEVGFTGTSFAGMTRRKSQRIWKKDVPGSWLTLSKGVGPLAILDDDIADNQEQIDKGIAELAE